MEIGEQAAEQPLSVPEVDAPEGFPAFTLNTTAPTGVFLALSIVSCEQVAMRKGVRAPSHQP